jgi:hypothetical protein
MEKWFALCKSPWVGEDPNKECLKWVAAILTRVLTQKYEKDT